MAFRHPGYWRDSIMPEFRRAGLDSQQAEVLVKARRVLADLPATFENRRRWRAKIWEGSRFSVADEGVRLHLVVRLPVAATPTAARAAIERVLDDIRAGGVTVEVFRYELRPKRLNKPKKSSGAPGLRGAPAAAREDQRPARTDASGSPPTDMFDVPGSWSEAFARAMADPAHQEAVEKIARKYWGRKPPTMAGMLQALMTLLPSVFTMPLRPSGPP